MKKFSNERKWPPRIGLTITPPSRFSDSPLIHPPKAKAMTATNVKNILSVFNLANAADQAVGLNWYAQAKKAATIMAQRYDIHPHEAAGVIAALSPRNRWERNLTDAENLIAAYAAAGAEGCATIKVCTFSANKAKAIRILSAGCITSGS